MANAQDGNFYVGALNPAHPIAQGVTLSNVGNDNDHFDQDGATWVVRGDDGNDYVLARDGTARTVIFGEQLIYWWSKGNQQLVRNAIEWAIPFDVDWLSKDPITGTMDADSAFPVEITFTILPTTTGGVYTATLIVNTGDPVNPHVNAPVTMTVVQAPAGRLHRHPVRSQRPAHPRRHPRHLPGHSPGPHRLAAHLLPAPRDAGLWSVAPFRFIVTHEA